MKVTKQYCDNPKCRAESDVLYVMDLDLPKFKFGSMFTDNDVPKVGKYTIDGCWELELCEKCIHDLAQLMIDWTGE